MPKTITLSDEELKQMRETATVLERARVVRNLFTQIALIINHYETEKVYSSFEAIEHVAKIVKFHTTEHVIAAEADGPYSGFAVIARHHLFGYMHLTKPDDARGLNFEEMWIFGMAYLPKHRDLARVINPIVALMDQSRVHTIPHEEVSNG